MKKALQFSTTGAQDIALRVFEEDFPRNTNFQPHLRVRGLQGAEVIDVWHKVRETYHPLMINGIPLQLTTQNVYVPLSAPLDIMLKKGVTVADDVLVGYYANDGWY